MKQLKKLTRNDKEYLSRRRLNPDEWGFVSENSECYIYANRNDPSKTITRNKFTSNSR